jgi:hypothetical protein
MPKAHGTLDVKWVDFAPGDTLTLMFNGSFEAGVGSGRIDTSLSRRMGKRVDGVGTFVANWMTNKEEGGQDAGTPADASAPADAGALPDAGAAADTGVRPEGGGGGAPAPGPAFLGFSVFDEQTAVMKSVWRR